MTGIRIQDTPENCKEVIRRLRHILSVNGVKGPYPSKGREERWYLRAYPYDKDLLFQQLEAAQHDYTVLHRDYVELLKEYKKLKQQLGLLQEPQPYDAVLSPKHDSSRLPSNLG